VRSRCARCCSSWPLSLHRRASTCQPRACAVCSALQCVLMLAHSARLAVGLRKARLVGAFHDTLTKLESVATATRGVQQRLTSTFDSLSPFADLLQRTPAQSILPDASETDPAVRAAFNEFVRTLPVKKSASSTKGRSLTKCDVCFLCLSPSHLELTAVRG
jgi:hypothetical protein